jgi:hypothetical protein
MPSIAKILRTSLLVVITAVICMGCRVDLVSLGENMKGRGGAPTHVPGVAVADLTVWNCADRGTGCQACGNTGPPAATMAGHAWSHRQPIDRYGTPGAVSCRCSARLDLYLHQGVSSMKPPRHPVRGERGCPGAPTRNGWARPGTEKGVDLCGPHLPSPISGAWIWP